MTDFTMKTDADGVAIITWDVQGKSMNVLSREAFATVETLIDQALADDAVKGIVLTSGKDSFAGGMDLNVLATIRAEAGDDPAQGLFDFTMNGHRILRKIERAGMDPKTNKGGKPVACAIPGTCARHRHRDRAGLPPPLHGRQSQGQDRPAGDPRRHLPRRRRHDAAMRMVGAMQAAPVLLEGKMLDPRKAKAAQLVDEVVAPGELLARAKEWVLSADADIVKPWDQKGYKMPGGAPYHPAGFMTFVGASAMINGKTKGVYPAAKALLSAVYEGALVPFRHRAPDRGALVHLRPDEPVFLGDDPVALPQQGGAGEGCEPPDVPDQRVKKVGIIGAGMMGAGIAYVSANAGIEVVLIDAAQEAADKGKAYSEGLLDKGMKRGKVTEEKKAEVLGRITATTDYAALAGRT
jgi:3-hydroxyacyl-CoA dehydrogenase/enoyl-CoA hydratase/3-hydroxybutyryl-CoA epimerase